MEITKSKKIFLRYLFVGFSGFCVQILINKILFFNINIDYNLSLFFGILSGSIWNFYFFNIIVFQKNKLKNFQLFNGLVKYFLTTFVSLTVNYTIAFFLFKNFKVNDVLSQICGISCAVFFNYFIYTKLIWKTNPKK
tara:strand:+ start:1016 stop:1426 length:411 start_codon:yes stop_codon:yes gene_type:complete